MRKIDRIEKYEVIEELGSGGMSRVYKCYDRDLDRNVAIKELRTELKENESVLERFLREAKIIARLDHPNIVRVYEFLELKRPQGRYFVMEYVDGVSLSRMLEKFKTLPIDVASYIALKVAQGLSYAHSEGVIHRDIKPSNVMISKKGDVKLMDFGISRSLAIADSLTSPGVFIGTPAYSSPEQMEGRSVDQRTDIFSFGAMLYEMLTGRVPFQSVDSKSIRERWKVENIRKYNPGVPRYFNKMVSRCLKYNPEKRYKNMDEVIGVLEYYLNKNVKDDPKLLLKKFIDAFETSQQDKTVPFQDKTVPLLDKTVRDQGSGAPIALSFWGVFRFLFVVGTFAFLVVQYHYSRDSSIFQGPKGILKISVSPWGNVLIKKHFEGKISSSFQEISLPAGEHSVIIENPFCEPVTLKVMIRKDITYEKVVELKNCKE